MAREPKTSARRVEGAENKQRAVELRKAGATYEQIGQQLGITRQSAHKHVMSAISEVRETTSETAQDVLYLELARLDAMLTGIWRQASQGNFAAIDRAIRIMERRAKLLGVDADSASRLDGTTINVQVAWPSPDPKVQPEPIIVDGDHFSEDDS